MSYIYEHLKSSDNPAYFWPIVGPVMASKPIVKELEGPLYDSPNHHWVLAFHEGKLAAVSSYILTGTTAQFQETYVFPEHRRKGLFSALFDLKYQYCVEAGVTLIKGLANPLSKPVFISRGWNETGRRGKWTIFQKAV